LSGEIKAAFVLFRIKRNAKHNAKEEANERKKERDKNIVDPCVFFFVTEK
jgi:hypothetical protein